MSTFKALFASSFPHTHTNHGKKRGIESRRKEHCHIEKRCKKGVWARNKPMKGTTRPLHATYHNKDPSMSVT